MSNEPTQSADGGPAFPRTGMCNNPIGGTSTSVLAEGMTLRQYAAIKLQVPNSGTNWLDEMIVEARRMDLAGQTMAALLRPAGSAPGLKKWTWSMMAAAVRRSANACWPDKPNPPQGPMKIRERESDARPRGSAPHHVGHD